MNILAIDPGTTQSALLAWDPIARVIGFRAILENNELLNELRVGHEAIGRPGGPRLPFRLVIERFVSYGKPVGASSLETCVWSGRFAEAWEFRTGNPADWLERVEVKKSLCHSGHAKDPHVRQALIDKLGAPGTKAKPGTTYGISKDLWAALAVAVAYAEIRQLAAAS